MKSVAAIWRTRAAEDRSHCRPIMQWPPHLKVTFGRQYNAKKRERITHNAKINVRGIRAILVTSQPHCLKFSLSKKYLKGTQGWVR